VSVYDKGLGGPPMEVFQDFKKILQKLLGCVVKAKLLIEGCKK